jgi:glycosyltransferase involved in cell wall biosynthesis
VHELASRNFPGMRWSPGMAGWLESQRPDLLHVHGLWGQASITVPRAARRLGIPYLVSPHGMLDRWALEHSSWKKRLAAAAYEGASLRGAACIHALCGSEADSIRAYGLKNPVCVVPNGVELVKAESGKRKAERLKRGRKVLLFLGRVHPKKGLVNAIRAWGKTRGQGAGDRGREEWAFVIAGWDQGGHEAELKQLATELGIPWADVRDRDAEDSDFRFLLSEFQLFFTGPAFGGRKDALLRRADAFILPSFSEGLPMSVLEAWSYQLPVLMTDHCNLPEGFAAEAAIRIGTGVGGRGQRSGVRGQGSGVRGREEGGREQPWGIDEGLEALFEMDEGERLSMGQRGRALVERQFSWPQVAAQMKEVYEGVV